MQIASYKLLNPGDGYIEIRLALVERVSAFVLNEIAVLFHA
jgi:hypothetical protein